VQSVLLVAAILAGLVVARWLVTGSLDRPMVPPGPGRPSPASVGREALTISAPDGTRLSLGGPAVTSIGAWHPGDEAAGLLRLDVDQAIDIVPTTLAAN
jgi:hypothetical protein